MKDRTPVAMTCLHISAILYAIAGVAFLASAWLQGDGTSLPAPIAVIGAVLTMAMAAGIEVVVVGLRRRKTWGWVAGLCILILFVPTFFFPLGVIGLWALYSPATRTSFGMGPRDWISNRSRSSTVKAIFVRLLLLTLFLTIVAVAYSHFTGVGLPPYKAAPEPSELDRVHRLTGLALFAITAISAAAVAVSAATYLVQIRRRNAA